MTFSLFDMNHPQYFPQLYQQPLVPSIPQDITSNNEQPTQRKRPKYTRSKTGCMTCRHKKIKCDERKPVCSRCSHGQRECSWPEGIPKKKLDKRKRPLSDDADDDRPTRRLSSEHSGSSNTPPPSDQHQLAPYINKSFLPHGLRTPSSPRNPNFQFPRLPITQSYPPSQSYPPTPQSAQFPPQRISFESSMYQNTEYVSQPWQQSHQVPLFPSPDPIEPYFRTVQERNLVEHPFF